MHRTKTPGLLFLLLLISYCSDAQVTDTTRFRTLAANPSLIKKSSSYQKNWGKNRRAEWGTPVTVPVLWLDTAYGGLKVYETGGGNETRSIRLSNTSGKEYSLRSINKSREDVVPPVAKGTFVEALINDQVSSSYPYGAFAVAQMQDAAGIPHPLPVLVYLPQQPALGKYNDKYGNDLYLFEQRPDGDWSDAPNFHNLKDFSSTDNVIKKLQENNKNRPDQRLFIRERLFDMFISDWDRHEDNFRWGKKQENGYTIYVPVPRDRDQAFYTHNGKLIDKFLPIAGLSFMHNFDSIPGSMKTLNSEEKDFDRFFSNGMSREDWIAEADHLQKSLTDEVIRRSVKDLPPEIYAISGEELIAKLIRRRNHLQQMAEEYYSLVASKVEIIGSEKNEVFSVTGSQNNSLTVNVFRVKDGKRESQEYYHRTFIPAETNEIRIYGIGGQDVFEIDNSSTITLRIIGGPDKDSLDQKGNRFHIYDDSKNIFHAEHAVYHLSSSDSVHAFNYRNFHYNTHGIKPIINYNDEDRLHVGLAYSFRKYGFRKDPYATEQSFGVKYSISQRAASAFYDAVWPHVIGRWDILFNANFDAARWTNFYGLGNNTISATDNIDYYRMISTEWVAKLGLRRQFANSEIEISAFYQQVDLKTNTARYATQVFLPVKPEVFDGNHYAGLNIGYKIAHVNDKVVPTKGFTMLLGAILSNNFTIHDLFQNYSARLQGFVPLGNKFSILLRAGGSTIVTEDDALLNAQPLMHAIIGGPSSIRGFRKERFWGRSSFYNDNELRFITNIRSHILNAKFGLLAFFDDGRVWFPGETSDLWHTGYGGGILIAPFNAFCLQVTYGISDEAKLLQIRMNKLF